MIADPEKRMEQSFVFINDNWEKLQNYQLHHNIDHTQLNKRRNLNHIKLNKQNEEKEENDDNNNNNNNNDNNDKNEEYKKDNNNNNNDGKIKIRANDFAQSLNVLEQILEISAGHAKVEHPLCSDCCDKITKDLDGEIEELNLEKKTLTDFICQWEQEQKEVNNTNIVPRVRSNNNYDIDEETRFKQYQEEANLLEKKLSNLAIEKERLKLEFEQLEMESFRMNEFEEMFFCDANDFWYSIENLSMQHSAVRQKIREISSHLDMMKRTNVFDDAFHIYHDGHFGTINGLRLGRLPSVAVEWEEINTGLGQCVLLLDVLAQRCKSKNFKFKLYELYPMGSFSYIKEKNKSNKSNSIEHHMYGSTGLFGYKQCDKALECFLQCIKQFADWMVSQDNKFHLRYQINKHEIGDIKNRKFVSIRFAGNTEENWTQALKYMVIDLKYLLAWVARYTN